MYTRLNKTYDVRASQITASSYLSEAWDPHIYHPVKAFDGKKESAWFEKAQGPGIGEYISITLDKPITIDKIVVSPGWFKPAYFWQNNRIKKLEIDLSGYREELRLLPRP